MYLVVDRLTCNLFLSLLKGLQTLLAQKIMNLTTEKLWMFLLSGNEIYARMKARMLNVFCVESKVSHPTIKKVKCSSFEDYFKFFAEK